MSQPPQETVSLPGEVSARRNSKERLLVFIVVFLGLLIVAGIAAVVLRIIYLASNPPAQRTIGEAPAAGVPGAVEASRLALPQGAIVKSVSIAGDRLAVHYEGPSGTGIAVMDLASGNVVRRIQVTPGEAAP